MSRLAIVVIIALALAACGPRVDTETGAGGACDAASSPASSSEASSAAAGGSGGSPGPDPCGEGIGRCEAPETGCCVWCWGPAPEGNPQGCPAGAPMCFGPSIYSYCGKGGEMCFGCAGGALACSDGVCQ